MNGPRIFVTISVSLLMLVGATPTQAQLRPAALFQDGVVLQRDAEVPVWGWAEAGTEVTVSIDGQSRTATATASGRWEVSLPSMTAGGPHTLTVRGDGDTLEVRDVLVGDVWICSGQSNMEWVVADARNAEQEIAQADDPQIRHFKVPRSWADTPEETLAGGQWEPAQSEYVGDFTAVGYFFARALRRHVDVPVGLINTSWGGSRIEPWMSADALGLDATDVQRILDEEQAREAKIRERLREAIGTLPTEDRGRSGSEAHWADPSLDDSDWSTMELPGRWEAAGYEGLDGVVWFRTTVRLSENAAREAAQLNLGPIDDADVTWVNGTEVGSTSGWTEPRTYDVPASALQVGPNVIAVRVEDSAGGGGFPGTPEQLSLDTAGEEHALAGPWRVKVGRVEVTLDGQKNQIPTLLYNKMIHPLLPYPITGVLWYQGESNAGPGDAYEYRTHFKDLITSWRERWNGETFPFLFVQLANYMDPPDEPTESSWAMLRESQSAALSLPNTAQAVTIDIGAADDIHPRNKQDVGRRLSRAARHLAYGRDLVYSGPVYADHQVDDGRVIVQFDHVDGGLVARGSDSLGGFAVAGPDSAFVWADARIEGDRVVVWSDQVERPVAVRYAWADNPADANLYNEAGLPAAPFRTDDW